MADYQTTYQKQYCEDCGMSWYGIDNYHECINDTEDESIDDEQHGGDVRVGTSIGGCGSEE